MANKQLAVSDERSALDDYLELSHRSWCLKSMDEYDNEGHVIRTAGECTCGRDEAASELAALRTQLATVTAERDVLREAAKPIQEWFKEYEPESEESFYQQDSVILALPELGIACMKLAALEQSK